MSALTGFRRPRPRYGVSAARESRWHAPGGWYQGGDGAWCRVYARSGSARTARRAVIRNVGGWWRWEVEQFDLATRAVRRVCARGAGGYLFWQAARGFADLAARTAD